MVLYTFMVKMSIASFAKLNSADHTQPWVFSFQIGSRLMCMLE